MNTIRILALSMIMLVTNVINAQIIDKLYNFENFVGVWKYETEQELFVLEIKEISYVSTIWKTPKQMHILVGAIKFIKDGTLVYDYLDQIEEYNENNNCIAFYLSEECKQLGSSIPQTELHVYFNDKKTINRAHYSSYLRVISSNPNKLRLYLEPDMWERDVWWYDEAGEPHEITDPELLNGFSIPTDMILEKIK